MKIKKIVAAIAAAAMAVSMVAVNAFAAVQLDAEYPGGWSLSKGIPQSEFEAIGGDVKVVLDVVVKEPLVGEHNHLARPMGSDWTQLEGCKGSTIIAKADGFIAIADTQTKLEIVVPEATWKGLKGYAEDNSDAAFCFQVNDVYFTSAELSPADGTEQDYMIIEEEDAKKVMEGELTRDAAAAPAADSAPAADTAPTTTAATGNVPAAVMVSVMAVAGAAAIASKKRK